MNAESSKTKKTLKARIGTRVSLIVNGIPQTWEIVSKKEADVSKCKVARDVPLIRLILGTKPGEVVEDRIGEREMNIEVVNVTPIPRT